MELNHKVIATWGGESEFGDFSSFNITIEILSIANMILQFDLFTITYIMVRSIDPITKEWIENKYEYTRMHRNISGDKITFQVMVFGDPETIVIDECRTKGYFVCKEVE